MNQQMGDTFLISIIGRDKVGVVSAVSNYLFEAGANLADCAFAVLGEGFEFSCVAEFTAEMEQEELETGLNDLELLDGARITVSKFPFKLLRGDSGTITHVVEISGGDRPGLVARMSEVLVDYGANIVRMSSRRVTSVGGGFDYRTRFAINVAEPITGIEAALYNTAGSLRLECSFEKV
ncbi:glycine cleavage system protein R [Kordiimonas pumila]|uniref:Glycine cleavage system protein R n=1 Tax=Kordiimonas pumila TaxID=2161677 RepID=A0ABV7D2M0_9PROT|nr:ACT domain-containing protein [Kordiimonas pumila]